MVFVGSMFFFGFLAVPTSIVRKMSRAALDSGGLWARFWKLLGSVLGVSGDYLVTFLCPSSLQVSSFLNTFSISVALP